MLRRIVVIARKELRQRFRDRSAIVLVVIAPLVIAAIMSGAFHGVTNFHFTLDVVNDDHGSIATSLVRGLDQPDVRDIVHVRMVSSAQVAADDVHSGAVSVALIIPVGFSASVLEERPEALLTDTSVNAVVAANTTQDIVESFVAQLNADRLSVVAAVDAGAGASAAPRLERAVRSWRLPMSIVERAIGSHPMTPISYFAPAMAIVFLLFQISFVSRSYFVDVATGMVDRVRTVPVRLVEIVYGKALSAFALSLLSLGVIAFATSTFFGATWGAPLPVALLSVGMALCVAGLCAVVMVCARTQREAEGLGSLVTFVLAILGGNFVYSSEMSQTMRDLTLATPNGWALRGFTDLATLGGGPAQVLAPLLALAAFAVGLMALASVLAMRSAT